MKLKFLSIIFLACFAFSSCSDDEVDFNNDLIGTWIPVIDENSKFPIEDVIYIFNSDKAGSIKYVTYTDENNYTERFSLRMGKIYFISNTEISVTTDTYHVNNDGTVNISTDNRSTYSKYIDYLSNDSLVFVDNHNINKKWHYTKTKLTSAQP